MSKIKAIVCDANILIDYFDNDKNILKLATQHCFEIYVPTPIFAEVKQMTLKDMDDLGLQLIEPGLEQLFEAIEISQRIGPSENDCICLIIARDMNWYCATNEKALYNKCSSEGIQAIRGLKIMIELVEKQILTKENSIKTAVKIKDSNPRITDKVIEQFIKLLNTNHGL